MTNVLSARLTGLSITVGDFLPRVRLPSLAGPILTPADIVEERSLAVCVYNPSDVNPFPLPPRGVDLSGRVGMLKERNVSLFVISGLTLSRLANWMDLLGHDFYALSDADRAFASRAGIPIKRVDERNFRTHAAFVLQEDRVLATLMETDPIHNFEGLLQAIDIATGSEPGDYRLEDQPWYRQRSSEFGSEGDDSDDDSDVSWGEFED
ncbi:MAG: hypothetical protein J5I90_04955 [Caldilineales bacterium]|nr:hypothetical protein [Caldilineales bacterium]